MCVATQVMVPRYKGSKVYSLKTLELIISQKWKFTATSKTKQFSIQVLNKVIRFYKK
jgi:hypothetical protein